MLTFHVTLHYDTVIRWTANIPAKEAGIVGNYYKGVPYQPDIQYMLNCLPYKYRKAVKRQISWWQPNGLSGRMIPLVMNLNSMRGKPMGTLYARPNWDVTDCK